MIEKLVLLIVFRFLPAFLLLIGIQSPTSPEDVYLRLFSNQACLKVMEGFAVLPSLVGS